MKKLRICLYFNNFGFSDVNLSNPEKGNPGIGGTHFNFVTLPYYFEKNYPGRIDWYMIGKGGNLLPEHISFISINDPIEIEEVLAREKFDFFIWKPANTKGLIDILQKFKQPSIAWCNNIPGPNELESLAQSQIIKKVVFAGHEALDVVRDHSVIKKSTVIFNGFDINSIPVNDVEKDPNLVVYMGSLVPAKCFHLLAEAWPSIIKENPKAKLKIIGSGALYDRSQKSGKFGLAESSYEDSFMKFLVDENGEILPSVVFMGLMGSEKAELLKQAQIGLINPHGKSEVCPGSAIEFQAAGTPVVAGARYGNLDVIQDDVTGKFVKSIPELIKVITHLLRDADTTKRMGQKGRKFIESKFAQEKIVADWKNLFEQLEQERPNEVFPMKSNWLYNFKIVFEILRIVKFKLGIFSKAPSIYEYIERKKGNET